MPRRQISQYSQNRWPRTTGFIAGATAAYKMKGALRAGTAPPAAQAVYNTAKKVGTYIRTKKNTTKSQLHQNAKLQVAGHGAGGTFTNVYIKKPLNKFTKNLLKNSSSNHTYVNASQRLTAQSGNQYYLTMSSSFNATDLASMFQSTNATCRTLVESVTQNDLYRNQSNNDCFLTIYDVVARRDMSSVTGHYTPNNAWYFGATDTGMTSLQTFIPGATPFAVPEFVQYFKVVKVSHIILPAGGCHNHRIHYEPNRKISRELIADNNVNVKDLTMYSMAVIYGAPDNNLLGSVVSTGSSVVDFVSTKQYKWTYFNDIVTNNSYVNNLGFIPTEYIMQDESGTAQAVTAA